MKAEKEQREGRRITWEEIAQESGVNRSTLWRHITNAPAAIYWETLEALVSYFDCTEDPGQLLACVPGERPRAYAERRNPGDPNA